MSTFQLGKKRAVFLDVTDYLDNPAYQISEEDKKSLARLDVAYRALVSLLYNYVPTSGHPGGSISSGRFVEHLLYKDMAYDITHPHKDEADIISYAAGHKALGLYAMWALRNECARIAAPELLPASDKEQLRLEDLLGFRHPKVQGTPLFKNSTPKPWAATRNRLFRLCVPLRVRAVWATARLSGLRLRRQMPTAKIAP